MGDLNHGEFGQPEIGVGRALKVSVSLPEDVVAEVRARVGPREFSSFVAQAVEQRLRLQMLGEIVDDYVARHGPISEEVAQEVDAEWRAALGR
jgi:Arc/MetJ-type ribon-helix-helix transcriptional regulator